MARQGRIPWTERPSIRAIDEAAEQLREVREELSQVKTREKAKTETLIKVMRDHGVHEYRDDDSVPPLLITLKTGSDKVKVTEVKPRPEESDDRAPRRRRSAAAASADPLEAEADRILANAGDGKLNDPKLKGEPTRHKKARTKSAKEVGAVTT